MDLTEVLTEDIWTDLLSDLNIYTENNDIFDSTDYLQQIILNNVQHKRYKQPVKTERTVYGYRIEEWKLDGQRHRDDGPAYIDWYSNGNKHVEVWYQNGQIHRVQVGLNSGPASIGWYRDGTKWTEEWYQNGREHRDGDPASIVWYQNGIKTTEGWYQNGQRHRNGDPAVTRWWEDGTKVYELLYQHGQLIKEVYY